MTINSPDSSPGDEPQEAAGGMKGRGDGSVPGGDDGVGLGADAVPNTFEPEEDPDATDAP